MKSKLTSLLVVAVVMLIGLPVFAQSLRANVPFDFIANGKTIAAGQLRISSLNTDYRLLMNVQAHQSVLCRTVTMEKGGPGQPKLVFHRYGSEYFLVQIWDGDKAEEVRATQKIRKAVASVRPDEEIVIALASETSGHGR
jgi:hypothetical protein